ncbi:NuA4 histone H4 acetyltransferase complex and the SWR1 complex subunit [Nowakowskiella sp. JEL0078]|nr:NuA4 histone H4 acetyltransferase complex and the SWR1 complex subunit [Nowakowskiella sp. JEL0078]
MSRRKNISVERGVLIGSVATALSKHELEGAHTHRWTVYVHGVNGEDISYFVKKVQFKLHESFATPLRVVESHPFEVIETGWGEFDILIKIFFVDPAEKQVQLYHRLQLFPKEEAGNATSPTGVATKKPSINPVVSEIYEEIVFNEPTEEMYQIMMNNPPTDLSVRNPNHNFNLAAEQEELARIIEAQGKVNELIEKFRNELRNAEDELHRLQ